MNVVSTAEVGVVNADTVFTFAQEGDVVSARYSGGRIRLGYLVGVLSGNSLRFRYSQVDLDGTIDGGQSTCEISRMNSGKIRLVEHFEWQSRNGVGTNIFEELPTQN